MANICPEVNLTQSDFVVVLGSRWFFGKLTANSGHPGNFWILAWEHRGRKENGFPAFKPPLFFIFHYAEGEQTFGGLLVDLPLVFHHKQAFHFAHSLHPFLNPSGWQDKLVRII